MTRTKLDAHGTTRRDIGEVIVADMLIDIAISGRVILVCADGESFALNAEQARQLARHLITAANEVQS